MIRPRLQYRLRAGRLVNTCGKASRTSAAPAAAAGEPLLRRAAAPSSQPAAAMLAEPLLASPPQQLQRSTLARRAAIFLVPLLALAWWMSLHSPPHHQSPQHSSLDSEPPFWFGVSLGGWLLIEINPLKKIKSKPDIRPQWMFDELEATSELDFVSRLRETSDDFAIRTMQNHWRHYLTDSMLTHAAGVGVNAVRIPVGYWIMDSPTNGSSPLQYGISPEGFVTGGLNHLRDMLRTLAKRNIVAIIDMHALPCNSACVVRRQSAARTLVLASAGGAGDSASLTTHPPPKPRRATGSTVPTRSPSCPTRSSATSSGARARARGPRVRGPSAAARELATARSSPRAGDATPAARGGTWASRASRT